MPNSLPFPVRVAAGLVASGIEALRSLPQQLPGMGVELIGTVTKVGLRLQQEVSELAARGDEFLESEPEPEEHPAWARFDDEDDEAAATEPAEPAEAADRAAEAADRASEDEEQAVDDAGEHADPANVPDPEPFADTASAGGLPLDGYDAMTIGQVRGHLRQLTRDDVRTLLEHEAATANRASFLTLLANRITTLEHDG